jgi:hypothetical protein
MAQPPLKYPAVADEFQTLDLVCAGKSIARYGDGEFNLVRGGNCVSQRAVPGIAEELRNILIQYIANLLVAIPRLDPRSPKDVNWRGLVPQYRPCLSAEMTYYSAFITRPDSAPWIATDTYYAQMASLWDGQDITMVYGSERSLSKGFAPMQSAKSITVVSTDYAHTYPKIAQILDGIVKAGNKRVLLMCGPTATCLAARLCRLGFHAVDLGHIGMWWMAHHNEKLIRHLKYE